MLKTKALILITVLLTACSTLEFPGVYRLSIEQGNIINGEMVAQMAPGLSKSQVEFILGKPLIQDPFSPNRWDYVYHLTNADKSVDRKFLTAYFDDQDRLSHFDTNVEPVTAEEKAAREKQKADAMAAKDTETASDETESSEPIRTVPTHGPRR